jgi:hypothetical protein
MIDRLEIIYEVLTGASPLATSIGTNCWTPVAPPSWDGNTAAIIYHQSSGSSHGSGATNSAEFIFKCYGGDNTWTSATTLFRLLYDRLYSGGITVSSGGIYSAALTTDSLLPPEDEKYKPHLGSFQIEFEG